MKNIILILSVASIHIQSFAQKSALYSCNLFLHKKTTLPFKFKLFNDDGHLSATLESGNTIMDLKVTPINDSLKCEFVEYNTFLIFKVKKEKITGFWVNANKINYKIPFTGTSKPKVTTKIPETIDMTSTTLNGHWETYFAFNTPDMFPALGVFNQNNSTVEGTFLTETGDYRFLTGTINAKHIFQLSCFDGAHAFLFKGKLEKDSIKGTFFSGNQYNTNFKGHLNEYYKLSNPLQITTVTDKSKVKDLSLTLKTNSGRTIKLQNSDFLGKVTVLQVMGTWCPNCFDETHFLNQVVDEFKTSRLSIRALAYEYGTDTLAQVKRIDAYSTKMNMLYPIYLSGSQLKTDASNDFPFLNKISSFPTTIILNKQGDVVKIYTGFSGPATGSYYLEFQKEFKETLTQLLAE